MKCTITIESRLVELEPNGEKCCVCGDAILLRGGGLQFLDASGVAFWDAECIFCGSCFDVMRELSDRKE